MSRAPRRYGFRLLPDLLVFHKLVCVATSPDWRAGEEASCGTGSMYRCGGILFDIEQNGFCWRSGARPPSLSEAEGSAEPVAAAPRSS